MMKLITVTLALCLSASAVLAQGTILQGGPWAPSHAPMYTGQGSGQAVVQDSGPAGGGATGYGLSEQLLVARGTGTPPYVGQGTGPFGTNWCDYDAPITNPTGYHFLCFSPNASILGVQGGQIVYGSGGAATPLPLQWCVNGTCYTPGGSLTGITVGTTTVGGGTNGYELYDNAGILGNRSQSAALDVACATNNYDLLRVAGVWGCGVLNAPVGGLPLYAAPTATGTGNCLSPANACTLPTACLFVKQIATFLGAPSIQLADGTYTTADASNFQCHVAGNGGGSSDLLVNINGDSITPTNVVIAIQSGQSGFYAEDGAEISVKNLECTNVNGGGSCFTARQNVVFDYNNIFWGAWGNSGNHVSAFGNAVIVNPANETFLASTTFVSHWLATQGAYIIPGGTTTIQSGVSWSQFAAAVNANFDVSGWTVSGTGTGTQFVGQGVGYLNLPNAISCPSKFPGSGGCSFTLGFQDSNGDGMTGTGLAVAQQSPTIFAPLVDAPIIQARTYAGLIAAYPSPTAGQISHIIDGLAANCTPDCTTPGATVTGGGGSLDLLIGWNGSNWLIFRAASAQATTGTGAVVHATSPTLVTPNLGTPSTLVLTNATGLPVAGGGTGNATAAAHSIPVSEGTSPQAAVGPCATNQVIVGGGGSADPTCGLNVAGAVVNLCTITANNSATLTNISNCAGLGGGGGFTSTYTSYRLEFQNIVPATDEKILELQIHSGGAFKTTGYLTNWLGYVNGFGVNGAPTTYIPLSYPTDANAASLHNAAPGFNGTVTITNPSASAIIHLNVSPLGYIDGAGAELGGFASGFWNTSGAVDGFQVLMDSGNITSGQIIVYGII